MVETACENENVHGDYSNSNEKMNMREFMKKNKMLNGEGIYSVSIINC